MPREKKLVSVRRATSSDLQGILRCLAEAFEAFRERYTAAAFADTVLTAETLEQRLALMSIFVAVDQSGEVIGTIACVVVSEDEGHIRGMAVRPTWQGAGVAADLLHAAESELHAHECSRITLDTTTPLRRAIQFYEKNGFQRSGRVTDFFGMPLIEYVKIVRA